MPFRGHGSRFWASSTGCLGPPVGGGLFCVSFGGINSFPGLIGIPRLGFDRTSVPPALGHEFGHQEVLAATSANKSAEPCEADSGRNIGALFLRLWGGHLCWGPPGGGSAKTGSKSGGAGGRPKFGRNRIPRARGRTSVGATGAF